MRLSVFIIIIVLYGTSFGCRGTATKNKVAESSGSGRVTEAEIAAPQDHGPADPEKMADISAYGPTAILLDSLEYIDIAIANPTITVDIVYATADNFMGEVLYDDLTQAFLLPEAAEKLLRAQALLKAEYPRYSLIVYDAARPFSVQKKMWNRAVRTGKQYYVSNPANGGGLHNYAAAVDVSIIDSDGNPLPMGTEYDHLGYESNIDKEAELVSKGVITSEELANRLLLRRIMRDAGFRTVTSEWWHFNHCSRAEAIEKYPLLDF